MRSSRHSLSKALAYAAILALIPLRAFAVNYPVTPPAGEQAGGWFQTYFDNMYTTPCGVNQFLNGFSLSGTLLCSTPGLYIAGILGQTLYYDGTNWAVSSNIWNDNTNVGIGTAIPGAKLDVNGDALINSLTIGRGSGSIASNTAFGYQAFYSNVTGINNVGIGYQTLYSNNAGFSNAALGYRALRNTTGNNNTGLGFESMYSNITGANNTAVGVDSLYLNTMGSNNTALGGGALSSLTSGNYNIALGYNANVPDSSGSGQLSIGNWIYGSGGKIGIGTGALNTAAILRVAGQIEINGGSPGPGKILTSDVNGLASWTGSITATSLSISGAVLGATMYYDGTDWIASTNVYNAGGNVGIGTAVPGAKLEVNGQIKITGGGVSTGRILTTDATGLATWQDPGVATTVPASGVISGVAGYLPFFGTGGNGLYSSLVFQTGGRIGIGVTTPAATLDVAGQVKISGSVPGVGKVLTSDAVGLASWADPAVASSVYATGILAGYGSGGYITQFMPFGTGITSSIMYQSGSFIGIGNTNPVYGLDITGTFRAVSNAVIGGTLQISGGTPGIGKVLTSDAVGLASWIDPAISPTAYATGIIASLGSGGYLTKFIAGGTGITSSRLFESGAFIGIGNTAPGYGLDVTGTFRNTGNAVVQGVFGASGATTLGSSLGVIGATTLGNTLGVSGAASLASTLGVSGATVLGSTLNTLGNTTLQGNLTTAGNTSLQGVLGVTGATTLGSTLGVSGAANLLSALTVGGATSLQGTLSVTGNTLLGGTIQIQGGSPALGRILTSDASGLASWSSVFNGSTSATGITGGASGYLSLFGSAGNGLYASRLFQSGVYMGIGTATPGYTLDVLGTGSFDGFQLTTGASSNYILTSDASGNARWSANAPTATNVYATGVLAAAGSGGYMTKFMAGGTGITSALAFESGSFVGIGLTNPVANLDISGSLRNTGNAVIGGVLQIVGGTPGLGKVLTSDASGIASWSSFISGATATGITGGASGYLSVFGTGGNGIYSSLLFQSGAFIGIGDITPAYNLDLSGSFRSTGNATIQGVLGVTGATTLGSTLGVSGAANLLSALTVGGATSLQGTLSVTGNTLLGGTIQIQGGSPALGRILTSDASGLASWSSVFNGSTSATGITGGASGYLSLFGSAGNGLYASRLFQSGVYMGIGTASPIYSLDVTGTFRNTGNALVGGTLQISGGSPGIGKVLTSNATGLASWASGTVTIDNIFGGTEGYITRFSTGGAGIMNSTLFETGGRIGLGTANPDATLEVTGSGLFTGDVTVQGKLITDSIVNRTVANVSISGSILPDTSAPLTYRDIGNDTTGSWNNLYLSGQIKIKGGTPGLGKLLMSDANGLATWTTFVSGATATGIVGGASGYLSLFGAGGNGLYSSRLFQSGVYIGIGNAAPAYSLDVTGTGQFTGLRIPTGASTNYVLVSDATGNARWANTVAISSTVYATGVLGAAGSGGYMTKFMAAGSGITSALLFETGGRIGMGTTTPQYMFDLRGSGSIVNAGSGLCIDGYCINAWSGLNDLVKSQGTPNYIAKFNSGGVIDNSSLYETGGKLYIGDIAGIIAGAATEGYITIESPGSTNSSNPFLTLSENGGQECRMWITGANKLGSNCTWGGGTSGFSYEPNQLIRADTAGTDLTGATLYQVGNFFGFGNSAPTSRFEVWTGSAVSSLMHFRGVENVGLGLSALNTGVSGSKNIGIGSSALGANTSGSRNIGIGSNAGSNITTGSNNIMIGSGVQISSAGWSDQLNIGNWIYGSGGKIGIGTGALSTTAILKVAGQIEITSGSPALGRILTSDASGLASWSSVFNGSTSATGITGGASGYLSLFGSAGNGLYASRLFQSGVYMGIGTATPGYTLEVVGTGSFYGLHISSGAAAGRVLTSDATGNASWTGLVTATSLSIAGSVTGSTLYYNGSAWISGTGLYNTGGNIGIGTITPGSKLTIDSGLTGTSGLRFANVSSTSTVVSNNIVGLGVDGSGNVVPISSGDVIVYDGITTGPPVPDPDNANREVSYDFNQYFRIPAKQSFVVSDGLAPGENAPYIDENATYSVCEWSGSYGSGMASCPATDSPGSPYNSFTMSARSDAGYGYQIGLAYRGDVPLMARSGRFRDGNDAGSDVDSDDYGSGLYIGATNEPAPWYKVFTVPTNHIEWFYIDTGYTGQFNATGRAGNVAVGTTTPDSKFEIWTGATTTSLMHFRGVENVGLGLGGLRTAVSGSRNIGIGSSALSAVTSGSRNVAVGPGAGNGITTGTNNITIGSGANVFYGTGSNQLSIGNWIYGTGGFIAIGNSNPASQFEVWSGSNSMVHFRGTDNVGFGLNAARYQASGTANSAFGDDALRTATTAYSNTALGSQSLYSNQTGFFNTAGGTQSLYTNSDGTWNVALGSQAGYTNLGGDYNVAIGGQSLYLNSSGQDSVALGYLALRSTTAGYNIGIGTEAGSGITTGTGNIMIGYRVQANSNTSSNQLNIGNWIYGSGGNIGIGIANPTAKLDVNGTFDLGVNGTQLNSVIKATVNKDLPNLASLACSAETFTVTNAQSSGSVMISPATALTDRLIIAYARVSAASTVEAKFCNESAGAINMAAMNFYITVIQ